MDGGSVIDDPFSKLHPSFPPKTRIAIVGAGPSGLSAAYALCKLGYSDVTVIEKHQSPGGMCESVEIEGKIYDLGGQVLAANSAPTIFHLAGEVGAETEEMDTHKFALIDDTTGALKEMKLVEDYVSVISLTLKLQDKAKASGRIGLHAVSNIAPDLAPGYLKTLGFQSVPKSVIYGYTASGYGFVEDMPYAYIHEFTRTSMAGKIRRFKGGYTSLWKKLSERYIGGLMAFELTERNSSYAFELVRRHFSNNNPEPSYPYVKRLLTLKPKDGGLVPKQLDESPGVNFPSLSSLDAYLQYWGTHSVTQSKALYTWINEKGLVVAQRTYKELNSNATEISKKLLISRNPIIKTGDRVLLVYLPGLDFIDAFFGCLRAGVIPVPAIPPDPSQKGGQALLHVSNIAKACNAVTILSTVNYHITVKAASARNILLLKGKSKSSPRWPDLPWLHTDSWVKKSKISDPSIHTVELYEPSAHDLCFLQYTSGSTGEAKGVMITHGGLIHNVKMMQRRYKSTSNTVLVSWLPQYHDMGLIGGLFTSMVSGGSAVLFSPLTFIRNPLLWLQTITTYHATHSAGPNFSFELLVRRLEANNTQQFDLSSMVFLMVAAEPIRATTMRKFLEFTQPFGLSQEVMAPGYGLAENCVYVCSAYGEGKEIMVDWQDRVCCGYVNPDADADADPDPDVHIQIVDPETGKEQENFEKEGEVWISSPSAGVGYWGMEELSQKTFRNELNDPGKKYTRTGDLGRIIDGKLFITGRIKDLVIIAGRNIYCSDVEKTVETSCELLRPGCCAAIGVPKDILSSKGISVTEIFDQVGLVVVAEVRDVKSIPEEVIKQIQTCVAEEHGIVVASVVLIKPKTISKTTSGKIKRFECLKRYADGTLDIVGQLTTGEKSQPHNGISTAAPQGINAHPSTHSSITKTDIIKFLMELLSQMTGISIANISTSESLVSYGVDSIGVVRAAQKLSDFLGVPVGAIDIFTATCINDLANFAENLLKKSRSQSAPELLQSTKMMSKASATVIEPSLSHKLAIWLMQLVGLVYVSFLLLFPAYISISKFTRWMSTSHTQMQLNTLFSYFIPLVCAPLSWMLCIFTTCICIAFLGTPFLQPNYALDPEISIWSAEFVKWWTLYKVQEVSSKVLAVHLRGTVFMNYWFRMLGAKVASSALIDTIDITDPFLVSIGEAAIVAEGALLQSHEVKNGMLSLNPIKIGSRSSVGPYACLQKGAVVEDGDEIPALGSGSVLEKDVILGALSVAPIDSVLQRGGVFVGSTTPVMVKNTVHSFDDRIEEMDMKYKKVLGNLAANFAGSTLKVGSRYFHRIGAAGKGFLKFYDQIPNLPDHLIFSPGKQYSIIMRHSNCLSSDDDARLDPRGAAIRILSNDPKEKSPLLDLTLKTGDAFHARTIGDFAAWLVCGAAAREEHVKHAPHIRDAMWGSLRQAESYTMLHYYSNICRLFRFKNGQEMYVKFKLRPFDTKFGEDTGKVEPMGILPPETGAIPRDENDKRPLLFLADDFKTRVNSPERIRYVLQLQIRSVPDNEMAREIALDCTKPWDETEFPHFDLGEITIDQMLTIEESEELEFNPYLRCNEVDVIHASSCNHSASMDHGRSVVYAICQHLRNKKPLPEAWRIFLNQSDVKVDLTGCPMAASLEKKVAKEVTLARPWYVTLWLMSGQPFIQTFLPYFLIGLVIFAPLNCIFYLNKIIKIQMQWLLPFFWICSGILAGLLCAVTKWILVGHKKEGEIEPIWSIGIFMDTTWQAIRTLVGEYYMEMTTGSFFFGIWMKLLGSKVAWDRGVYVDSLGAVLNPELVEVQEYGSVEREALLFGHIYEGEGGKVKYGKIVVGQGGFVGSRAVAMPGVTVGTRGSLGALSLAMKEEFIN